MRSGAEAPLRWRPSDMRCERPTKPPIRPPRLARRLPLIFGLYEVRTSCVVVGEGSQVSFRCRSGAPRDSQLKKVFFEQFSDHKVELVNS